VLFEIASAPKLTFFFFSFFFLFYFCHDQLRIECESVSLHLVLSAASRLRGHSTLESSNFVCVLRFFIFLQRLNTVECVAFLPLAVVDVIFVYCLISFSRLDHRFRERIWLRRRQQRRFVLLRSCFCVKTHDTCWSV
jgi:hypothetical protein